MSAGRRRKDFYTYQLSFVLVYTYVIVFLHFLDKVSVSAQFFVTATLSD